jgi:hypothetical protein
MYPSKLGESQVRPPKPAALRSACHLSIRLDISHVSQLLVRVVLPVDQVYGQLPENMLDSFTPFLSAPCSMTCCAKHPQPPTVPSPWGCRR